MEEPKNKANRYTWFSTFSSLMIDNLPDKAPTENYGVAYVYFNYKEQAKQRPVHILASLVKQFTYQISHLPSEIEDMYTNLEPQGKSPTLKGLYATLLVVTSTKYFSQAFVVCDALDECDQESQREQLLPLLNGMGESGINLFITS